MQLKRLSKITGALILLALSGCVTRTVSQQEQVPLPKRTPEMMVRGPDPLLFPQCWTEIQAKGQTSAPTLTPSCQQLRNWLDSIDSSKTNPSPSR